nr:hypothetical protein [Tanacetum cinerariifolium]
MVRDSVQLETAVNTISYEYLLDFTSEYGIPKTLHPELPGPGDRIVDFPEGKVGVYTRLANKYFQRWDAGEWYLLRRRCEGPGHASYPHPKTTGDVTVHGRNKSQILSGGRGSSRGGKSLAAMQLCLASNVFVSECVPADVSDPDPLAFADAPSPHPADVAQ